MRSNKTVLITGASSGIGKATAEYFAARGWNVAATMRSPNQSDLASKSKAISLFRLDVTDQSSINTCVADVIAEFGSIDVVVNNAGYGLVGPFEAQTDEQIRRQFETNLFGVMNVTRAVLPHMRKRKSGRIVNVASGMGQLSDMGGHSPAYRVSKTALNALTRILTAELEDENILVNSCCPGWVRTDMGGPGAPRSVEEGADTPVWLATLPDDGPRGGFFRNREPIPW